MFTRNKLSLLVLLTILALILVACGGGTEEETPEAQPTEATVEEEPTDEPAPAATEEMMVEVDFPVAPGGFLEQAIHGDFAGTVVTVDGPFADADVVRFDASMAAFEEATGIDVQYIGGKEFETTISVRVDAGDAPDIADFPQPGLLNTFVSQGKVVDPTTWIPADWLSEQYNQS